MHCTLGQDSIPGSQMFIIFCHVRSYMLPWRLIEMSNFDSDLHQFNVNCNRLKNLKHCGIYIIKCNQQQV